MSDEATAQQRVTQHWAEAAAARQESSFRGWLDSPLVMAEYVQPLQTGGRNKSWLVDAVERLGLPRDGHWLSLGCGAAASEIFASQMGLFASMRAYDLSAGAIEIARRAAAAQGVTNIEFGIMDLNQPDLPEAAFDAALMCMSLHHVSNLEGCLAAIERSLRPGGAFLANEFVGPRRFQFTPLQVALVRELLAILPPRLRVQGNSGELKTEYRVQPIEHWLAVDPSESVRSDEIPGQLAAHFDLVFRADYGGAILHLLLEGIVQNFDPAREEDVALLRLLGHFEQTLQRHGLLASDLAVFGMRRQAPSPRWRPWRRAVAARRK